MRCIVPVSDVEARKPEITQLHHPSVREQNIGRLEVTVHYSSIFVQVHEPSRDLAHNVEFLQVCVAAIFDPTPQVPCTEFCDHHNVAGAPEEADANEPDRVFVPQSRQRLGLGRNLSAGITHVVVETNVAPQHLHGDVNAFVSAPVHSPTSSTANYVPQFQITFAQLPRVPALILEQRC